MAACNALKWQPVCAPVHCMWRLVCCGSCWCKLGMPAVLFGHHPSHLAHPALPLLLLVQVGHVP